MRRARRRGVEAMKTPKIVIADLDGAIALIEHLRHWLDAERHPEMTADLFSGRAGGFLTRRHLNSLSSGRQNAAKLIALTMGEDYTLAVSDSNGTQSIA